MPTPSTWRGYTLPDGIAAADHQLADYQKSVHYAALTKGNDLSAPTCNDCHGNHGAAPPGVGGRQCLRHLSRGVRAEVRDQRARGRFRQGCVECHSNHAVLKPSDADAGRRRHRPSARPCHSGATTSRQGAAAAASMRGDIERLKTGIDAVGGALLARLRNAGIEVSDQQLALRRRGPS